MELFDLTLTNRPKSLQSACAVGTGLYNFHRMTVSVLKTHFRKFLPRIISYRDFSDYKNTNFINSLNELHLEEESMESFLKDPNYFHKVSMLHVRKKYILENNISFLNKILSKAKMLKTKL